jgi:hypothetical protein
MPLGCLSVAVAAAYAVDGPSLPVLVRYELRLATGPVGAKARRCSKMLAAFMLELAAERPPPGRVT